MELWIEGTPEEVIRTANDGLADAIATNPGIMERWTAGGRTLEQVVGEVCVATRVPVFVQLHGPDSDTFLREMDSLRRISDRIQPKIVATLPGFTACRRLAAAGVKPLITTVSTLDQAFLAARSNAAYVAPYVARMLDATQDGYELVRDIAAMYRLHDVTTQITAASIRTPAQAEHILRAGAPVLVMGYDVLNELCDSDLTHSWIDGFEKNWRQIPHALGQ